MDEQTFTPAVGQEADPTRVKMKSYGVVGFWHNETRARLQRMVGEGLSASEIARELGCTRNAVVGFCHRNNIQLVRGLAITRPIGDIVDHAVKILARNPDIPAWQLASELHVGLVRLQQVQALLGLPVSVRQRLLTPEQRARKNARKRERTRQRLSLAGRLRNAQKHLPSSITASAEWGEPRALSSDYSNSALNALQRKTPDWITTRTTDPVDPAGSAFDAAIPFEQRKNLDNLGPSQCKFPVGDPQSGEDFFFCGAPRFLATPYCEHHAKRCYARKA